MQFSILFHAISPLKEELKITQNHKIFTEVSINSYTIICDIFNEASFYVQILSDADDFLLIS